MPEPSGERGNIFAKLRRAASSLSGAARPTTRSVDPQPALKKMAEVGAGVPDIYFPHEALTPMAGLLTTESKRRTQVGTCWEIPERPDLAGRTVGYIIGRDPASESTHIALGEAYTSGVHAILLVEYNPNGRPTSNIDLLPLGTSNGTDICEPGKNEFYKAKPGRRVRLTQNMLDSNGNTSADTTRIRFGGEKTYDVVVTPGATDTASKQPIALILRER